MPRWRTVKSYVSMLVIGVIGCALSACGKWRDGVSWVNPMQPLPDNAEHFVMESQALGHPVGVSVQLPPDYFISEGRYPVIYFLHGSGGHESSDVIGFLKFMRPILRERGLQEPIVVFPNGGRSQYQGQVEPMIMDELIPHIDSRYRTEAHARQRLVAGFSMGGAGAIRLSVRHPDSFGGAVSWAGGMWHKDEALLEAVVANADQLNANGFSALMINGENDRAQVFARLEALFNERGVDNKRVVLDGVGHDFGLYLSRTGTLFGEFLQEKLQSR